MKKLLVITLIVGVIGTLSLGAYAYRGSHEGMMGGQWGSMMGGRGPMHDMGSQGRGQHQFCPCGDADAQNTTCPRWNAQGQTGTAPAMQLITEDKAKQVAEEYIGKYLPGYTVDKIEKDNWRPMYLVTIKGPQDVLQQMLIQGFSGQVMHVFPKSVEKPAEPATKPAEK